jgi:hypothetical protein
MQDWTQRPGTGNLAHMDLVHMDPQELQGVLEVLKIIKQCINMLKLNISVLIPGMHYFKSEIHPS